MARAERTRSCEVCRCEIRNRGKGTAHSPRCNDCGRACAWERRAPQIGHEPQNVTNLIPPPNTILGRPLDDPRNNARLNKSRQDETHDFLSPVRIGVLDIETTGLNAGFGVVLCAVIKAYSPNERRIFRADEFEPWRRGERANDKPLLEAILSYLEDIDIVIAHNGLKFDMPFLRTRAVIHNLPPVNFQKIIDPVQLARQHFRFAGNSLDSIAKTLSTRAAKTPLTPEVWQRASLNGDADAMREIVEHCEYDVDVLEEVCWKLRGYVKQINMAGSYRVG